MVGALLLETAATGEVLKLELATAAGLLTLHPEDSTLHGNVVRPAGIDHVALSWSGEQVLLVVGTPATAAAAARMLDTRIGVGEGHTIAAVSVDVELTVTAATYRVLRPAPRRWRFVAADGSGETAVTLDEDGTPVLDAAQQWPLELEPGP